jgi:hypothetical protein
MTQGISMRQLLMQDPLTFNELLDLFEGYIASVYEPIIKGHDMLREEIGAGEHVALGHIFGVACNSEDMFERLDEIRAARNAGTDVTITLTRIGALRLEHTIREIDRMFGAAGAVFELLHDRAGADVENEDSGAKAVIALAQRALMDGEEREMADLRRFAARLREAGKYQQPDQEDGE